MEREQRRKERHEKDLKELKRMLDEQTMELKSKQGQLAQAEDNIARLEQRVKDQHAFIQKQVKDFEKLNHEHHRTKGQLDDAQTQSNQLKAEVELRAQSIKTKELEIDKIRQEAESVKKNAERMQQKVSKVEQQVFNANRDKEQLKQELERLQKQLDSQKKLQDGDKKEIEELKRQKDILGKHLQKEKTDTRTQQDLVKMQEASKKTMEMEMASYKSENQKQRKMIFQLEKEREKYGAEASEAMSKYISAQEEVKLRDLTIVNLRKKIHEAETRLKQQQNLYEAVRSDRNLYSKNLIEAQDEIQEMRRKFKIMNHQISQLKEEIQAKDSALMNVHLEHARLEKEREMQKADIQKLKNNLLEADNTCKSLQQEIKKLETIIEKGEREMERQRKELDEVINERDILGTQLIRRNDELALLYEKIKIQQSTLKKGEVQYRERIEDIRILKLKINDMKRELQLLSGSVSNIDSLRNEVYHLQRELLQERTKVKALSEELENPMNVHRWRKLEGSDPDTYEMIQKIQTLQKRLIAKTEEVVEKDLLIQEKEKLYVELKNILARQPGPEVAEQLSVYQTNLREKTKQMKAMAAELNMYQAQVNEYKFEIERLTRELQDVKKKYFEQKRREQLNRDSGQGGKQQLRTGTVQQSAQRFTGGGFSLGS